MECYSLRSILMTCLVAWKTIKRELPDRSCMAFLQGKSANVNNVIPVRMVQNKLEVSARRTCSHNMH